MQDGNELSESAPITDEGLMRLVILEWIKWSPAGGLRD